MNDDFNTPNAIAALFDFIKEANTIISAHDYNEQNKSEVIEFLTQIDKIFKCFDTLNEQKTDDRREIIEKLIQERNEYRKAKDFAKADELKQKIIELGAEIMDNKDGTTTYKLN